MLMLNLQRRLSKAKFLIGAFPTLFGTDLGLRLQQWARLGVRLMDPGPCQRAGKALVWALGPNNLRVVGAIGHWDEENAQAERPSAGAPAFNFDLM